MAARPKASVSNGKLAAWYAAEWSKRAVAERPHTFVFGVGDDANVPLLRMLASQRRIFRLGAVHRTDRIQAECVSRQDRSRSRSRISRWPSTPAANVDLIYPLEDAHFAGSMATWVGQYKQPVPRATFTVSGMRDRQPLRISTHDGAARDRPSDHPELPRTWAKARVDALLEKIEREGEDRATIDEIIRLSKKYKFVTPYTSFLAVPRALLRPRVIRPGDPVLRVKTDESIVSVIALFPFGLIKPLRYLKEEDTWQTRFLAPVDMEDGVLSGAPDPARSRWPCVSRVEELRHCQQDSGAARAPRKAARPRRRDDSHLGAGSGNARTITARLYGALPVALHWSTAAKANIGRADGSRDAAAGQIRDSRHRRRHRANVGTQEVALEVW